MGKKDRLAARNAKLTERAQKATTSVEEEKKVTVVAKTAQQLATEIAQLEEKIVQAKKDKTAFIHQHHDMEDKDPAKNVQYIPRGGLGIHSKHNIESHFRGPGGAALTETLRGFETKIKVAKQALETYRLTYDVEYIEERKKYNAGMKARVEQRKEQVKENVTKIQFFEKIFGSDPVNARYLRKHEKKQDKERVEVILRYHDQLDSKNYLKCAHYDAETLQVFGCDCVRAYACGCITKAWCRDCKVAVCQCKIQDIVYERYHEVDCFKSTCFEVATMHWHCKITLSVRASARLARQKTRISNEKPSIKITRNAAGFLIGKNKDGTFDTGGVRCYHALSPMDDFLSCDCTRDATTGDFVISERTEAFMKDGYKVIVDNRYVQSARELVEALPENEVHMRNPHGFGGFATPCFSEPSPAEQRELDFAKKFCSFHLEDLEDQ